MIRSSMSADSAIRFCKCPLERPACNIFHALICSKEVINHALLLSEFLMKITFMATCVCFRIYFILLKYLCNTVVILHFKVLFMSVNFFYDCKTSVIKGMMSTLWKLCFFLFCSLVDILPL